MRRGRRREEKRGGGTERRGGARDGWRGGRTDGERGKRAEMWVEEGGGGGVRISGMNQTSGTRAWSEGRTTTSPGVTPPVPTQSHIHFK